MKLFLIMYLWPFTFAVGSQPLAQDSILMKYYDAEEITRMQAILDFFDKHMIKNCQGNNELSVCYQQFFDRLKGSDSIPIGVPFEEQIELYLKDIGQPLFRDIWTYSPGRTRKKDGSLQYNNGITYNSLGRYREFLKDVAEEEPYFDQYVHPITSAGDLSPSLYKGFTYDSSGLDFNNERHRLILTIHFLTVNDILVTQPR